jgi:hypothetical protein
MPPTNDMLETTLNPVRVEFGKIINVNFEKRTVDFRSEFSERFAYDIPWTSPYFDQIVGSGITFIPEPGMTALCMHISESKRKPVIIAFIGAPERKTDDDEQSYLCGQQKGNPGDILINGRDGNFLAIKRGGIVQVGSNPICQTLYFPIRNIIQNIAENYEINSFAGDLSFEVLRKEDSSEGQSKCIFEIAVREFANDEKPMVTLSIGALDNDNNFILECRDKGGGNTKVTFTVKKSGEITWKTEEKLTINTKQDFALQSDAKISVKSKNDLEIKSETGKVTIDGVTGEVHATGTLDVKADGTLNMRGSTINLNNGLFGVVRNSPDFIAFINSVAAVVNSVTAGACTVPVLHEATTVKA